MVVPYRIALLALLLSQAALANTIVAYVEAPTIQASSLSNITTVDFNGFATGNYTTPLVTAIGTYEGTSSEKFQIIAADQYGGAGGTGNYFAVGTESGSAGPVLLNLNAQENYFGFWWSAGDVNNSISFFENGTLLATFTTANIVSLLPNTSNGIVTAINGSTYNTKSYYGNPNNTTKDTGEPFAYVDVIANGLTFNQISFSNTLSTGFESDNHSVAVGVVDPPSGDVIVENVPLTAAAQAPEPSTLLLLAAVLCCAATWKIRRSLF